MAIFNSFPNTAQDQCGECGFIETPPNPIRIWWCDDCGCHLCDNCWPNATAHRQGRTNRDRVPHEKVEPLVQQTLEHVLRPCFTEDQLDKLHEDDEYTTWFGVGKEKGGDAFLTDGGIYESLMARCHVEGSTKHPQLVSFIGQTDAGKSTLIKMLVTLAERRNNPNGGFTFPSPVVGSRDHPAATSADVHLYPDPDSFYTSRPMLYADCEGLDAGEQPPRATLKARRGETRRYAIAGGRIRYLKWADTEESRTRNFIVSELYPRLLYTFSDVVVFVLRNVKTFQKTALERLLKWAEASLETSINQATLPHAIIAVNAADLKLSDREWDVDYATSQLLRSIPSKVSKDPYFLELADIWRRRGKTIRTVSDLIKCYYSSFTVVRIPMEGRPGLMLSQINRLRARITRCCKDSYRARQAARMLSNSDELGIFMQVAFDHFSNDLETPFNFIEASLNTNPIPEDFGSNILQLAIAMQKRDLDSKSIFDKLSKFVASCVFLNCVRYQKGLPQNLLAEYKGHFEHALDEFCHTYSPCQFENLRGYCVNSYALHTKGHQNSKGKIIADGPYESDFVYDDCRDDWMAKIADHMETLQTFLQSDRDRDRASPATPDETLVLRQHSAIMADFYGNRSPAHKFTSHLICVCCFMDIAQHPLPCGHILCTSCVKGYGDCVNKHDFSLRWCPLHPDETRWDVAFIIRFKPEFAGVRILSLDGGGVRGIVQLEVLRSIQRELGDNIPIRAFFDLIVGTGTGGVIAIAIGAKNWSLSSYETQFKRFSHSAFTPREFNSVPILGQLARLRHGSIYKTQPMYRSLKAAFGPGLFYGGKRVTNARNKTKIAVTATEMEGRRAILIANYNRIVEKNVSFGRGRKPIYEFRRPCNPAQELCSWEAAAATCATPQYFKPFFHKASHRYFLDGALYNTNTAKVAQHERKFLWPEVADRAPDIFLSIGPSQNGADIQYRMNGMRREAKTRRSSQQTNSQPERTTFPSSRHVITTMSDRMGNILDSELAWREFVDLIATEGTEESSRYIRINPDISANPPELDAVGQIKQLQSDTKRALKRTRMAAEIRNVAHRLVASSFFFRSASKPTAEPGDVFKCIGHIACKFEDGSEDMRNLGRFLKMRSFHNFQPYFEIWEDSLQLDRQRVTITADDIRRMEDSATFHVERVELSRLARTSLVNISLCLMHPRDTRESLFPISGFPRALILDELPIRSNPMSSTMPENFRSRYRMSRGWMSTSTILSASAPRLPVTARSVTHSEPLMCAAAELSSSEPCQDLRPGVHAELPGHRERVELSCTCDHTELPSSRLSSANWNAAQVTNIPPTFAYTNNAEPIASPSLQPLAQGSRPIGQDAIKCDQERDQGPPRASGSHYSSQLRSRSNSYHVERDPSPAELPASSTSHPIEFYPKPAAKSRERHSLNVQETSAVPPQSTKSSRPTRGADPDGRRWTSPSITSQNQNPYSDGHKANTATKRLSTRLGKERRTVLTKSPLSVFENLHRGGSGSYRGDASDEDMSQLGGGSVCESQLGGGSVCESQLGGGSVCESRRYW